MKKSSRLAHLIMGTLASLTLIASSFVFVPPVLADDAGFQSVQVCMDATDPQRRSSPGKAEAWWNRRSPEEQKLLIALPCGEKYIAATCMFLYDPNLKKCTDQGVARKRASASCAAKGLALLSPEAAACEAKYVENFKPDY